MTASKRLVRRFRRGHADAAWELLDTYGEHLYQTAFRLTGDSDMAKDVVQEALLRVLDRNTRYRGGDLGAWLKTITARTALNLLKHERRQADRAGYYACVSAGPAPAHRDPFLHDLLVAEIAALPDAQRLVFVLIELEEWTHDEVAGALDISPEASRQRLRRAREALKAKLNRLTSTSGSES